MTQPNRGRRLGDMNGWTIPLLKVNLILIPIIAGGLLTWGSWVTVETIKNKEFRERGDRYTAAMAAQDVSALREWVRGLFSEHERREQ